jgi:hypothetical protein
MAGYMIASTVYGSLIVASVTFAERTRIKRNQPLTADAVVARRARGLYFAVLLSVVLLTGWFTMFYGYLPSYVGGGLPQPLAREEAGSREHDRGWLSSLCSTSLSLSLRARCRTVYRIYGTDKHVYLAVDDSAKTCNWAPLEDLQLGAALRWYTGPLRDEKVRRVTWYHRDSDASSRPRSAFLRALAS